MNKTLLGMLAIGTIFFAGSAAAFGGSLGGTYDLGTDVNAHADYSGVLRAVDDAKGQADAAVGAAQDAAGEAQAAASQQANTAIGIGIGTKDGVQMEATKDADLGMKAGISAKQGIFDSASDNLAAIADWFGGLWVKPVVDAKHAEDADALMNVVDDVQSHDGSIDAYYGQDLTSTARADYNIPPPPTPSLGFLGSIKATFEGLFEIA